MELREMLRGAAHLMDFAGVLSPQLPPDRTAADDMADAWRDITVVLGPPVTDRSKRDTDA